jgi:hypothetical protein
MYDSFDVSLEDDDLLGELQLTTNLIIAASEAHTDLTQPVIDQLLGLQPGPGDLTEGPTAPPARRRA